MDKKCRLLSISWHQCFSFVEFRAPYHPRDRINRVVALVNLTKGNALSLQIIRDRTQVVLLTGWSPYQGSR